MKDNKNPASRLGLLDVLELVLLAAVGVHLANISGRVGTLVDLDLALDFAVVGPPAEAVSAPNPESPSGDVDEARDTDVVGSPGAEVVGKSALNRREDGTTGDTHDEETGTATSVATETGGGEDEDDGVEDGLEEHDHHQADETRETLEGTNADAEDGADDGVDAKEHRGGHEGEESDTNDTADAELSVKVDRRLEYSREEDKSVREEVGRLGIGVSTGLGRVVDEEGTDGDLGADVEELSDETGDGAVLLAEGLEGLDILTVNIGEGSGFGLECLLGDFGKLGGNKGDDDDNTHERDSEVDPLNVVEVGLVTAGEEVLGGDEGTGEGSDTVHRLRDLETEVGGADRGHDSDVRVGGSLEGSETTSNDSSADDETTEDGLVVTADGELCNGPEENGTERVERETHDDSLLVAATLEDLSGDRGEGKVTDTEVGDLKTSRLELGDVKDILEVPGRL